MKSLAAWLLLFAALLMCAAGAESALGPFAPDRGAPDAAQHWAFALRSVVLGPALYCGFAVMLGLIHRVSLRAGGWRAENLDWGRVVWRHIISRTILTCALLSLLVSLPGTLAFGFNSWAVNDYLMRPLSVIAWGAALEYLWRIASALENEKFVASATSMKTQLSWQSRVAGVLVVIAIGYYVISAILFATVMSSLPTGGDFSLSVAGTISVWVQEPLRFVAVGGCIEYLLRIAKALPQGKILTHEPAP
ncbi:MAG: hypothetical protein QM759_04380 [Terricaulis sp.]